MQLMIDSGLPTNKLIWLSTHQGLTLVSVGKNQISLKLLHLLYKSVREVDSHIWIL